MALSWQGSSRDNRYHGLGDFKERSPYPKLVFTLPTHDGSSVEKDIKQHYQEVMKPEKKCSLDRFLALAPWRRWD